MAGLESSEIAEKLKALPGWERREKAIAKRFRFREFMDGIRFVNRIAEIAEATDHHPDILINYTRITFVCSTHSENVVTEKDFALARHIEDAARNVGAS